MDPESKLLLRTGRGREGKPCAIGHALMEDRGARGNSGRRPQVQILRGSARHLGVRRLRHQPTRRRPFVSISGWLKTTGELREPASEGGNEPSWRPSSLDPHTIDSESPSSNPPNIRRPSHLPKPRAAWRLQWLQRKRNSGRLLHNSPNRKQMRRSSSVSQGTLTVASWKEKSAVVCPSPRISTRWRPAAKCQGPSSCR